MSDLQRTSIGDISGYTGLIFVTVQPHPPTTHISSQTRAMKFCFHITCNQVLANKVGS